MFSFVIISSYMCCVVDCSMAYYTSFAHCYFIVCAGHSTNDMFLFRGGNPTLCPHIRTPGPTQTTNQWIYISIYIYSIVVYLCYKNYSLSWLHMNSFYITVMPIGTCSLVLALEGGIASIKIQIFISVTPFNGRKIYAAHTFTFTAVQQWKQLPSNIKN